MAWGAAIRAAGMPLKIAFDFRFIFGYSEGGIDGSGAGKPTVGKQQLRGETQKGLQPCGLWPTVWVPVTAASVD